MIDADREDVGIARERLRGQHAAVREAPDADAIRIDVRARLQVLARREHVLVLGVAAAAGVRRGAERLAVADAAAVVHRHHDVALARQPLIDGVGDVVEVHVVVAEQHLPRPDHRARTRSPGRFSPGFRSFGRKS